MAMKDQPIDKRLAERFLSQGQLDSAEYAEYLASLPDVSEKCEFPSAANDGTEQGADDNDED